MSTASHIASLLDKYWACESSLEEEKELKAYFAQPTVAPELAQYRPLFGCLAEEQRQSTSEPFERVLLQRIEPQSTRKIRGHWLQNGLRVAASLIIILSCAFYFTHQQAKKQEVAVLQDTYEDPEEAYKAVRKALMVVSANLNEGASYAASIQKLSKGADALGVDRPGGHDPTTIP